MARFESDGIDALISEMNREGALVGKAADAVLLAGAEGVKRAWQEAAEKHGLRDTGDMIKSIGYSRSVKSVGDWKQVDIFPQGSDRKGVRNAEKAFVLHYGTSKIPATHWVDDADALSEQYALPLMQAAWDSNK